MFGSTGSLSPGLSPAQHALGTVQTPGQPCCTRLCYFQGRRSSAMAGQVGVTSVVGAVPGGGISSAAPAMWRPL